MTHFRLFSFWLFLMAINIPAVAQDAVGPCSCCSDEYRQFDFWLGEWVVYSNGRTVGFNKIAKIESNCILRENWKSSVSSHTGTSYSFYDKSIRKWKHVWVDNQGKSLILTGTFRNRQMVLESEEYRDEKGNRVIERITWSHNSDGTVRQIWEKSEDGGQAFSVQFDGLYRKRT